MLPPKVSKSDAEKVKLTYWVTTTINRNEDKIVSVYGNH